MLRVIFLPKKTIVVTKSGKVIVKFYVTDKKDSFTVKFFTTPEDYDEIFKNIIST